MSIPQPQARRKRKHVRLWPLLLFPLAGVFAGYYFGHERIPLPFGTRIPLLSGIGSSDPFTSAIFGLLGGCILMMASASAVLAYRVSQRRFTIGAILITIAVVAVLLGWARTNLF